MSEILTDELGNKRYCDEPGCNDYAVNEVHDPYAKGVPHQQEYVYECPAHVGSNSPEFLESVARKWGYLHKSETPRSGKA